MKVLFAALAALCFAYLATGCGQSGPLYIPGDPSRIETSPPPPQEEDEEDENGDDNDER